jgi:mannose-6-phosphate isomerase
MPRPEIYSLGFVPEFRPYLWGGRNLERLYGRALPPGNVAESWEISGHPSAPTRVEDGAWRGRTLPEVLEALGLDLVGRRSTAALRRGRFPLLIKLLDANRDLSVQVHPADEYAHLHENGELGKTELWYVLHAEPGTELIYGLAAGVTRASFEAAIQHDALVTQLQRVAVAPGDCLCLPAGMVHALLAGAVVAEIQQSSDTTYRVYDWGRVDALGRPRPLHIAKALEVINWGQIEPRKAEPWPLVSAPGVRHELLSDCVKFATERVVLDSGASFAGACLGDTFEIWGCVAGEARLEWAGEPVVAAAVRFLLLPAALGPFVVRAMRPSTLLRVYIAR